MIGRLLLAVSLLFLGAVPASAQLAAAVLPSSRAIQVGNAATVFATIVNGGNSAATGCSIAPATAIPLQSFSYQTTSSATNQPTGTANTPANIPAHGSQSFVLALTPGSAFSSTEVAFTFDCNNTDPVVNAPGINTLQLFACSAPTTDIITIAATPTNDGIVHVPGIGGAAAFSVAALNIGAAASAEPCRESTLVFGTPAGTLYQVIADTQSGVETSICQTNPSTGACLIPPAGQAFIPAPPPNTPMTFSVFVQGVGTPVPFDPANNRIVVRFTEYLMTNTPTGQQLPWVVGGRGSTSVAVTTQ